MDIGIGYMGGVGGTVPIATATLEGHLGGPAWLVVGGSGGWSQWSDSSGMSSSVTSAGLRVGPRFEWPVVARFDAGFHVHATGGVSHAVSTPGYDSDVWNVGGVAGGSIHFRASPVFGVRVAIDVVHGGYVNASLDEEAGSSSGYIQAAPSPSVELTFTF